jgi:hypothetical protein
MVREGQVVKIESISTMLERGSFRRCSRFQLLSNVPGLFWNLSRRAYIEPALRWDLRLNLIGKSESWA